MPCLLCADRANHRLGVAHRTEEQQDRKERLNQLESKVDTTHRYIYVWPGVPVFEVVHTMSHV